MGGSDTGSDKKTFFFSVILQNRPGNRSAYVLVMLRSDIGSPKNYRLRFFGFCGKSSNIDRGIDPDNFFFGFSRSFVDRLNFELLEKQKYD